MLRTGLGATAVNLLDFLSVVIEDGIAAARKSYANDPEKRAGAVAGFEACRGKSPTELLALLEGARSDTRLAYVLDARDYWRARCYEAEIEWVCNCVSAVLENEGHAPIINPTYRGVMKANAVLQGVAG